MTEAEAMFNRMCPWVTDPSTVNCKTVGEFYAALGDLVRKTGTFKPEMCAGPTLLAFSDKTGQTWMISVPRIRAGAEGIRWGYQAEAGSRGGAQAVGAHSWCQEPRSMGARSVARQFARGHLNAGVRRPA